ncbi:MAG: TRAM domain-containing protein [Thermoprotei archaeon]
MQVRSGTALSEENALREESESRGNNRHFGSRSLSPKPVKVGDEVEVTITEVSRRGDGVTRVQGYVIFVPNAKQGENLKVRISQIRPNYAIGEIIK